MANGTSGLTTGKTVGQGASVSISAKTGTAETTVDEANKPHTTVLWRMHRQTIQRLRSSGLST